MAVEVTKQPCPRCGHLLVTDRDILWCRNVGEREERPCLFGIDSPVVLSRVVFGFDGAGIWFHRAALCGVGCPPG